MLAYILSFLTTLVPSFLLLTYVEGKDSFLLLYCPVTLDMGHLEGILYLGLEGCRQQADC
jgi:hypothetical protein